MMNTLPVSLIVFVMSLVLLEGCAEVTPPVSQEMHLKSMLFSFPQQIEELAGRWEYQDTAGKGLITLDVEGKGAYEWEEGWFETHSLKNRTWAGVWIQKGNDREGGFELTFSDNAAVAQGKWWYTRIGKDHDPLEPGGSFTMTRLPAVQISQ